MRCSWQTTLLVIVALTLNSCASLQRSDPIQVTVAGIESLPGEGFEVRMMVKLRVQNPNDMPVEYDGVYLKMEVLDQTFATGVTDVRGSVPRFGESIVGVPVTVSVLRMARHALGMLDGKPIDKINYVLDGKLNGPVLGATRFQAQGQLTLPAAMAAERQP